MPEQTYPQHSVVVRMELADGGCRVSVFDTDAPDIPLASSVVSIGDMLKAQSAVMNGQQVNVTLSKFGVPKNDDRS